MDPSRLEINSFMDSKVLHFAGNGKSIFSIDINNCNEKSVTYSITNCWFNLLLKLKWVQADIFSKPGGVSPFLCSSEICLDVRWNLTFNLRPCQY